VGLNEGAAEEHLPTNLVQLKEEILKLWVIGIEDSAYLKNLVTPCPRDSRR
jgi:hypothetical protein